MIRTLGEFRYAKQYDNSEQYDKSRLENFSLSCVGEILRSTIIQLLNFKIMKGYLYVERDDAHFDKKSGFESYAEANNYRNQCQMGWINHYDIVYYIDENHKRHMLTGMADVKKFCEEHDIPYGY